MIIPVAYVFGGGGGGSGTPKVKAPESQPSPGEGSGGGFGFVSWPIGAYVIKNGELYDGDTLDTIYPVAKKLDKQYWWDTAPSSRSNRAPVR